MTTASVVHAQESDFELPLIVMDDVDSVDYQEEQIDLSRIVYTATRGLTTVEEAPAIVTVVTEEEIVDRGLRQVNDIADTVPGWLRDDGLYGQIANIGIRGTTQSALMLVNGVSMFDPIFNTISVGRVFPVETIKRIELITGPGGVLWGSNSYLGLVNIITKDAGDINGVEGAVRYGDGSGADNDFRAYLLAGYEDILGTGISAMAHGSFNRYNHNGLQSPMRFFGSRSPAPASPEFRGPLVEATTDDSYIFNFDGKISFDSFNLSFSAPIVQRRTAFGNEGIPVQATRPEDGRTDDMGMPVCPNDPSIVGLVDDCLDPARVNRSNEASWFERYVMADYSARFADGQAGLAFKAYGIQFKRPFRTSVFNPFSSITVPGLGDIPGNEGGISVNAPFEAYRVGGAIDGDVELPANIRLLYGVEAFREWVPNQRDFGSGGIETSFNSPLDESQLPDCPRFPDGNGGLEYVEGCPGTVLFNGARTTLGAYLNPQIKIGRKLTLDGGARIQVAPDSLSDGQDVGFDREALYSGALVYQLAKNWHAKVNYAQGFRPPVFNNLLGNSEKEQISAVRDLQVERSQSTQGEINARLFQGVRRIRELGMRLDYAYTKLENTISIGNGQYYNSEPIGIHSAEMLAKLYLEGGHRIEFSYSWAKKHTEGQGPVLFNPEHWFHIGGVFNVIENKLRATTRMRILGAFEDVNKLVEYRDLILNEDGRSENLAFGGVGCHPFAPTNQMGCVALNPSEVTVDRMGPVGELTFGLTYFPIPKIELAAWAYNAFDQRYHNADFLGDLTGEQNRVPNQAADFRFLLQATFRQ